MVPPPSHRHDEDDEEAEDRRRLMATSESGSPNCIVVGLDCRSMNLYRFLRVRFPALPHGTLRGWITEGKVEVNGEPVVDSRPLRFGDVVDIDADVEASRKARRPPVQRLLYEDAAMIAVDKPAGLATSGERSDKAPHLLGRLQRERPAAAVKLVHRIDKHASGVVVFALGRDSKRRLQEEFSRRRVVKDYLAIVSGHLDDLPQVIDVSLSPRRGKVQRMVVTPGRGKASVTLVRAAFRFRGYTVVHARPLTGRTHQIRSHLRHLGHAIVGDATYQGEEKLLLSSLKYGYRRARGESERPLLARLALHAFRIALTSPATGATVVCSSPLPKDLRSALRQLQKAAGTRPVRDFEAFLADPLGVAGATDPFAGIMAEGLSRLPAPDSAPPG